MREPSDPITRFDAMSAEYERVVPFALRSSRPIDILGILGKGRRETYHSAMIAWLCDPCGSHGFGNNFFKEFLPPLLGARSVHPHHFIVESVKCEVPGTLQWNSQRIACRADIVVKTKATTWIIENKVDSEERPDQCEKLKRAFGQESRFVFLTPQGRGTESEHDSDGTRFQYVSYRHVESALEKTLGAHESIRTGRALALNESRLGVHSAFNYLLTIRSQFGMGSTWNERALFFGKNYDDIRAWIEMEGVWQAKSDSFLKELRSDVRQLAKEFNVKCYDSLEETNRLLLLYKSEWMGRQDVYPRCGIGLEWHKSVNLLDEAKTPYLGTWIWLYSTNWNGRGFKKVHQDDVARLRIPPFSNAFESIPQVEEGLQQYATAIINDLRSTWHDLHKVIDKKLA